jgi:hypothetical protein
MISRKIGYLISCTVLEKGSRREGVREKYKMK